MTEKPIGYSRRTVLKNGAIALGAIALGGTATSGTAAAGIGDGRVGHYHLNNLHLNKDTEEKIKDHVHDASTYKNHGTNHDAEVVKDGAVGNAFAFDSNNAYVVVDHDPSLNVTAFTVATWLKFTESAEYQFFLSKRGDGGDEYQVYYRGADAGTPNTLAYWDGDTIYDDNLSLATNTWHHLTWVVDQDGFRGYHNGDEVVTKSNAGTPPGEGTSSLYIGTDNVGNYAKGMADEIRIYDRTLSENEIEELASMGDD